MGFVGNLLDIVDIDVILGFIQDVNIYGCLMLVNGQYEVDFLVDQCMNFYVDNLLLYENGMCIIVLVGDKVFYSQMYYFIGGGFIVDEEYFGQIIEVLVVVFYFYKNVVDLQCYCCEIGLLFFGLMMQNELVLYSKEVFE